MSDYLKHRVRLLLGAAMLLLAAGCSLHSIGQYAVSADNVETARMRFGRRTGNFVAVGPFNSVPPGLSEIWCRMNSPIETPDRQPFADYIRTALMDDLRLADALADDGAIRLSGRLDRVDFDSWEGKWNLAATIALASGESFVVTETYEFDSSWIAEIACDRVSLAFIPAVQNLVRKILSHPALSAAAG